MGPLFNISKAAHSMFARTFYIIYQLFRCWADEHRAVVQRWARDDDDDDGPDWVPDGEIPFLSYIQQSH